MRRLVTAVAVAGVIVAGVPAVGQAVTLPAASTVALLDRIPTADEFVTGYDRSLFDHWVDVDRDGCDTRREVLISEAVRKPRVGAGCALVGGKWKSKYDRKTLRDASDLDVDHMVPLNEAWQSGAYRWDAATRTAFANDLDYQYSLIGVSASSNGSKSDQQPGEWNPPSRLYRCTYFAQWVNVKYRWGLSMDPVEKDTLRSYLTKCGWKGRMRTAPKAAVGVGVMPAVPTGVFVSPAPSAGGDDPRFDACTAARAAGFGPYYRDRDPEYGWYRDGDGDGAVCE